MKYLVTGASGQLGSYVLNYLSGLVPFSEIAALVRDDKKPLSVKGVEKRTGNYADYDSLVRAFSGVERLLFISAGIEGRQVQHRNVVRAAKEAGVSFIAYTSVANASDSALPLAQDHKLTEQWIKESGIFHTFLRNNWYLENELNDIKGALAGRPYVISSGEGRTGWALRREYAEAAVNVLTGKAGEKEILELSGKPVTTFALAEAIKEVTKTDFEILELTRGEHKDYLVKAGLQDFLIDYLVGIQGYMKQGCLNVESGDFETVLGHPLTPLKEAVSELTA